MDKSQGSLIHLALPVLLGLCGQRLCAGTFGWKNPPVSGAFNSPARWQNADGNGGFPGAGDFAIFIDGTYTVTCDGAVAGMTEMIGTVTFQLNGDYSAGSYIQGGHSVVLQGGGTLRAGPFNSLSDGDILVDGSGLTMDGFDFGTRGLQTKIRGANGARIKSSAQPINPVHPVHKPRLESGSTWQHEGALYVNTVYITGGSLLASDEFTGRAELDGGRMQLGLLKGGGRAINGSTVTAKTAALNEWLLEGSGNSVHVLSTTVPGVIYADISIKSGATFSAGALADNAWYTVDGGGSQLAVAGQITADGPQKVTLQNGGQGSAGSLSKVSLFVRDAGSLFSFANTAENSTVQVQRGGRVHGGSFVGPSTPTSSAGCLVSGTGSAVVLSGNLELGMSREGAVTLQEGGRFECAKGLLDGGLDGGTTGGSVFGAGSFWLAREGMAVGHSRGVATLNLGDGGRVEVRGETTALALGLLSGSEGQMDVNGGNGPSPSVLDTRLTAETGVGVGGKGTLSVINLGRILATKLTVGVREGSEGSVSVIGTGTSLEVGDTLEVGRAGVAQLTIFSGGLATAPDVRIGSTTGTNQLRVTGKGSQLQVAKSLRVGTHGMGQLRVEQGGQVLLTGTFTDPDLTGAGLCDVGANEGATGYISVNGTGSILSGPNGFLNLGMTGSGNLTVLNGGAVQFASISVVGGQNRSSSGSISGAGSVVRARDSLGIGAPFPGPTTDEVAVTQGGLLESKSTLAVGKTGILRLNGGSAVAGQTDEAPIPDTVLVANFGRFYLGGRLIGSVLVRQGGVFLPGFSPGKALIEGNLTLSTGTSLEMELGGDSAGTTHDQIETTGTATLAGHLDVVFRDGFAPTNGQVFELVKAGSVAGNFSDVTVKGLAPGFTYTLDTAGGKGLRLTATSAGVATTPPNLKITRLGATQVVVSWPGFVSGWTLQQATGFPATAWVPIAAPGNSVTLPVSEGSRFFRLVSP